MKCIAILFLLAGLSLALPVEKQGYEAEALTELLRSLRGQVQSHVAQTQRKVSEEDLAELMNFMQEAKAEFIDFDFVGTALRQFGECIVRNLGDIPLPSNFLNRIANRDFRVLLDLGRGAIPVALDCAGPIVAPLIRPFIGGQVQSHAVSREEAKAQNVQDIIQRVQEFVQSVERETGIDLTAFFKCLAPRLLESSSKTDALEAVFRCAAEATGSTAPQLPGAELQAQASKVVSEEDLVKMMLSKLDDDEAKAQIVSLLRPAVQLLLRTFGRPFAECLFGRVTDISLDELSTLFQEAPSIFRMCAQEAFGSGAATIINFVTG